MSNKTTNDTVDLAKKRQLIDQLNMIPKKKAAQRLSPMPVQDDYPLSSIQQGIWVLNTLHKGDASYNMPFLYDISGPFSPEKFQQAVNVAIKRHGALRTYFTYVNDQPRQKILPEISFELQLVDISQQTAEQQQVQQQALIATDIQTPFDLAQPPLIRM